MKKSGLYPTVARAQIALTELLTAGFRIGLMSHPDPNGPPDLRPIQIGEVWENPVTGERGTILELPWKNPDHRFVAELLALVGARVWASTATRRWSSASRSLMVS